MQAHGFVVYRSKGKMVLYVAEFVWTIWEGNKSNRHLTYLTTVETEPEAQRLCALANDGDD